MRKYTLDILRDENLIVLEAIMGSRAYGTSLPTSDTDLRGVFIQPEEDILGFGYVDQVADKLNDIVFYEIKRFLQLVQSNNPNILELLNAPKECIIHKDPIFDLVLEQKEQFITKQCKNSFAGYAIGQIKKARGYNKKINWEENEMVRKGVLDFCYILLNGGTITLAQHLKTLNRYRTVKIDQTDIGLVKMDHAHDMYAMYDMSEHDMHKGIVSNVDKAADVQLSSVPKGCTILGHLYFNKDAYSTHCKRYAEYKEWLDNRNEDRFKMNKEHGKQYDSKNMMHTFRLLNMATEIAEGKIIVRRPSDEIATLMQIRRGEMDYEELLYQAEALIAKLDDLFDNSNLPEKVDQEFVDILLITIRKLRYH
jgi:hypothetical protein